MTKYTGLYRFGFTPWERYGTAASASIASLLDREETERANPLGRALDLDAAEASTPPELARRGWEAVGIDNVPAAVDAARRRTTNGATYVVGDVTDLLSAELGSFDFFLDIGCFQGLNTGQRRAEADGVTALANPDATLLMLAFGPTRVRWLLEGTSQQEVESAFRDWEMLAVEPADTAGLGWPMNKTAPQWYRLRRA